MSAPRETAAAVHAKAADPAIRSLAELWGEIKDLDAATNLLQWDQETTMPSGGIAARGKTLATLAGIAHDRLTAPRLRETLAACAELAESLDRSGGAPNGAPNGELAAQVARARRRVEREVLVPAALRRELAEVSSTALAAWQEARQKADFAHFAPHLSRLVDLKRQEAAAVSPHGNAYDALLDEYEPGITEAELIPLFDQLRRELTPLVRTVVEERAPVDESPARGHFPVAAQRAFGIEVATAMGFDFNAGRLDPAAHPFCISMSPGDVRMTWRWQEDDLRPGLFGIVHEAGHALYEQGLPAACERTPIGEAVSLGIHESQSRLWENEVARSPAFWRWALPRFRHHFPAAAGVSVEALWPTLNRIEPTLIRVEADQATYNLHVAVRFEIERALFAGDLEVADLPARWNELYTDLLGITPADDAEGVLQDIHWSMGSFGYFPTYTLGTLAAAQLFAAARRDLGDLEARFEAGDFAPLLAWLRASIHRHGSRYSAAELIARATGKALSADAFLAHLRRLIERVYPPAPAA